MPNTIKKVTRRIKHTLRRSKIDKVRVARIKFLYEKISQRNKVIGAKYEAAVEELRKPNPNIRIVNSAETLIRDNISDAEKTIHHVNRIRGNVNKPGALRNRLSGRSVHDLSTIWQCANEYQTEARKYLTRLTKMKETRG